MARNFGKKDGDIDWDAILDFAQSISPDLGSDLEGLLAAIFAGQPTSKQLALKVLNLIYERVDWENTDSSTFSQIVTLFVVQTYEITKQDAPKSFELLDRLSIVGRTSKRAPDRLIAMNTAVLSNPGRALKALEAPSAAYKKFFHPGVH